jgi:DNA mismatch endonuclease (patch repair protein)
MADIFDKAKRSKIMGLVKGKNTKPEVQLRKELHAHGFRFRIHDKKLPGNPDIKLTKYKTVIFINGCFWHGHQGCKYYTIPKNNNSFWVDKLQTNISRDILNYNKLINLGWNIIIIWTCNLKARKMESSIMEIISRLSKTNINQAHKNSFFTI